MPARSRTRKSATTRASRGPKRSPGISRIDQPSTRTHGWFVRLNYKVGRDGECRPKHTKFFGDFSNGGKLKGLKAAEKWVKGIRRMDKKKPSR